MGFVSKSDTVAACTPCDKVVVLKQPITTHNGVFEAGTTAYIKQDADSHGCYFRIYSSNAEDFFSLDDYIKHLQSNMWKYPEEIRSFSEEYFTVDEEKTKTLNKKLNSFNMLSATLLFLMSALVVLVAAACGIFIGNILDLPNYVPAIFSAVTLTAYIYIIRKSIKLFNAETNMQNIGKMLSKL